MSISVADFQRIESASNAAAVTPSNDTQLTATRALWVGGAGDVEVIMVGGQTVVFAAVPAGTLLPIRVTHVKADNTDATSIVAVW